MEFQCNENDYKEERKYALLLYKNVIYSIRWSWGKCAGFNMFKVNLG